MITEHLSTTTLAEMELKEQLNANAIVEKEKLQLKMLTLFLRS